MQQGRAVSTPGQGGIAQHTVTTVGYRGPLPPPEVLRGFADLVPDAPERILRLLESDSAHEQRVEVSRQEVEAREAARLQWMAFAICVLALLLAGWLGYAGHEWLAGTFVTVVGATTVMRFLRKGHGSDDSQSDDAGGKPK